MAKFPATEEVDAFTQAFQPYFTAVGRVAHSWNHLHEELGKVFCAIVGLDLSVGMSIWHALKSDRSQRDILQAAVDGRSADAKWAERHPDAAEGLRYLLKETNKLATNRNDAIHAPCSLGLNPEPHRPELRFWPLRFSETRRPRT